MVKKKVIVIGGGFTGSIVAKKLQRRFDVTLIDARGYFEYTPAILRTILEPRHCRKIQKNHKEYLRHSEVLKDEVTKVTGSKVFTKKGKALGFDYLVIASGSSYAIPIKEEGLVPATRAAELAVYHNELERAEKILIIGGGVVGVELAAEIVTHYKDKEVTIVHSHPELMERNHPKTRRYAERFLKERGCMIIFGERVKNADGPSGKRRRFKTDKGRSIETDFSFITVGIVPNYEFMKSDYRKLLDDQNEIIVNPYLQLKGRANIFVGGDVNSIKEEKTAQASEKQGLVIAKNIVRLEKQRSLLKYESKNKPMVISLGKHDGILEKGGLVIGGLVPAFLKWFVEKKSMAKR